MDFLDNKVIKFYLSSGLLKLRSIRVKGFSALFGSLLVVTTSQCFASGLKFEDFKAAEVFAGQNHALLPVDHSNLWMDEARAQAIAGKVNFAGHYILYKFGCGGSTFCGEVLDARTGEVVTGLPNAYNGDSLVLSYQSDSNLIIISGVTADSEKDMKGKSLKRGDRVRYYEFANNTFRLLKIKDE